MKSKKDVFLSYASGDKDKYVLPLVQELDKRGISYWLDEAEIKWGERITKKIEEGLNRSRYMVVLLSDNFLGRAWPESELGSALNRENSDGQTVVLPLIATDVKKVLDHYPLLRDKLYLHWNRGVAFIADRLGDLLHFTIQETSASEGVMTISDENTAGQGAESASPQLLDTVVLFSWTDSSDCYSEFSRLNPRIFAIITRWIEYEEVISGLDSLDFPGGSFELFRFSEPPQVTLRLSPGIIPLHQILTELGENYNAIEFRTDSRFDLGDLVRRSRNGVRRLVTLRTDEATFSFPQAQAELTLRNTEEGSTITISTQHVFLFRHDKPPIPYSVALRYLDKDPPTDELENAIGEACGRRLSFP